MVIVYAKVSMLSDTYVVWVEHYGWFWEAPLDFLIDSTDSYIFVPGTVTD